MPSGGATKGRGKTAQWLRDRQDYDGSECLIWPFYIDPVRGYGPMGYEGKMTKAHIFMCKLINGERPTPKHEAAHSCGNGRIGCVHPKHLSWKTKKQNALDKVAHGTASWGDRVSRWKLTPEQVSEIRRTQDATVTSLADRYRVDRSTITKIRSGELWPDVA